MVISNLRPLQAAHRLADYTKSSCRPSRLYAVVSSANLATGQRPASITGWSLIAKKTLSTLPEYIMLLSVSPESTANRTAIILRMVSFRILVPTIRETP